MKSKAVVNRELRRLRKAIDGTELSIAERRIAYAIECAILWATTETVGWSRPLETAKENAECLKQDL